MRARAVFLDRDGVLNRAVVREGRPRPPATLQDLEILPGVADACGTLRLAGLRLIVVTNQPEVGRGTLALDVVNEMNLALKRGLRLDDVRVCPHDDGDRCECRKPAPGMLLAAAREWDISLPASVMVGDRWRDVESGKRAGCKTVFIDYGYAEPRPESPDLVVRSLAEAVPWILRTLEGISP